MQGTANERVGRLVSATRMAKKEPNSAVMRQTIVKRRASIGVFLKFGMHFALPALNRR
jgi:hypothetical protein